MKWLPDEKGNPVPAIDRDPTLEGILYEPASRKAQRLNMRMRPDRAKMRNLYASGALHGDRGPDRTDIAVYLTVAAAMLLGVGLFAWAVLR